MMTDTDSGTTSKRTKLLSNAIRKILIILLIITFFHLYSIAQLYENMEKLLDGPVVGSQTEGEVVLETASRYKQLYSVMGQSSGDHAANGIVSEKVVNTVGQNETFTDTDPKLSTWQKNSVMGRSSGDHAANGVVSDKVVNVVPSIKQEQSKTFSDTDSKLSAWQKNPVMGKSSGDHAANGVASEKVLNVVPSVKQEQNETFSDTDLKFTSWQNNSVMGKPSGHHAANGVVSEKVVNVVPSINQEQNETFTDPDPKFTSWLFSKRGLNCIFKPAKDGYPIPLVLFSRGRSGSSVVWQTISNLLGRQNYGPELTGTNDKNSIHFFNDLIPQEVGGKWVHCALCLMQHGQKESAAIVGFQWKPVRATFTHKYAVGGLNYISSNQQRAKRGEAPIGIHAILLRRNELDRLISTLKHERSLIIAQENKIPPHCRADDEECVKFHMKFASSIELPVGEELLQYFDKQYQHDYLAEKAMKDLKMEYIKVDYNKLFKSTNADEWMKIFNYLGIGPKTGLTVDMVKDHMTLAATSSRGHKEMISNYDAVKDTLRGTKYEDLID